MIVRRSLHNPILQPVNDHAWEAEAVFNGCPIQKGSTIHLLYRAVSLPHYHAHAEREMRVSDIGIAQSKDGLRFDDRRRFIVPEHEWERFGCEDPRVTKLNGTYYIFYTALSNFPFSAEGIKVGLATSKNLETVDQKHLITPFNAKAMALFPEKINGKITAILTVNTDQPPAKICVAQFNREEDLWSKKYWDSWYKQLDDHAVPLVRRPEDQVEVGAPPLKTRYGWLLVYSYIRNYFSGPRTFGIEAVLLDLKNPQKIIGRTDSPLLVPEEIYERFGVAPNIVFPSGALINKNILSIYYGAADTVCAVATLELDRLLASMLKIDRRKTSFRRAKENPILSPIPQHEWESKAVFNPAALRLSNNVHIVYRAMSHDNTSVLGYAVSRDGIHIDYRDPDPIYFPRAEFEKKLVPGGNSGCEDPRLTLIGDRIYMCYTAFDGAHPPRIAFTSIEKNDFLNRRWSWDLPVLISPPDWDNKDAAVFPEKVKGKYLIFHRMGHDIDIAPVPNLSFDGKTWLEEQRWLKTRKWTWDSSKCGISAPPLKTKKGWILLYHGISMYDGQYRVGAVLMDLKDPTQIIARTDHPLFEPEMPYEKNGQVGNVVFPCGAVLMGEKVFIYYGGADQVIGVATIGLEEIFQALN